MRRRAKAWKQDVTARSCSGLDLILDAIYVDKDMDMYLY